MKYQHRVLGMLSLLSVITYLDRVCIVVAGPRSNGCAQSTYVCVEKLAAAGCGATGCRRVDRFGSTNRSPLGDHSLLILALLSVFGADVMARARRARGTQVVGDGYTRFP